MKVRIERLKKRRHEGDLVCEHINGSKVLASSFEVVTSSEGTLKSLRFRVGV